MMSRASRMLKWVGAITVLLAAAPIAYAETSAPAAAADPVQPPSARCGGESSMQVTPPYLGGQSPPGIRAAGDGLNPWSADGLTYRSLPNATACADPRSANPVAETTVGTPDGADTVTH